MTYSLQLAKCYFSTRKKFHMHRRKISINPVKKGKNVDLCKIATAEGDMVNVHAQRNNKFVVIAK